MNIKININTNTVFAPLPMGRVTIKKSYDAGSSLVLGSNYCWHEPAGWKTRTWRYLIEEEDYFDLLDLLHQIGGEEVEMEVEMEVISKITLSSINLPDPADLDEM